MIMPFSRRTDTKVAICSLHGDQSIPDCTRWWLLFPTIPRSLASEKKGISCITSVACAVGPSVATSSTDFSFQNLFLEFIWIFSSRNHFKINISHILNPNLPNKFHYILLIKLFPTNTKGTFQFSKIFSNDLIEFSVKKSSNIQKLLHCMSKHHGTKPMHPSSSRAFQRHQEHDLKHPPLVDLITTKQNKTKQTKLPP